MKKSVLVFLLMMGCSPTIPTYEVKFSGNTIDVAVDGFGMSEYLVVEDRSYPYDILLVKDSPGAYHTIFMQCSYDKKDLDVATSEVVCPVCYSTYNFDGTVKKGPADTDLGRFNTELNPDKTLVKINIESLSR